ncbi:general secretion pathway protein GspI, partial [Pseudomonas coronafaciens]
VSRSDRLSHAARTIMDQESAGPLENATRKGTLSGIDWTLDIHQLPGANGQPRLFRLDLSLNEHQRKAQFSTLKLRGAVTGAGS